MYILALQGSFRGDKGITGLMLKRFSEGILKSEPSSQMETIYLAEEDIQSCCGCLTCWLKTPGVCRLKDGMAALIDKYKRADIIIAATPLYFDSMSSNMKKFWERLLPVMEPYFENGTQKVRHKMRDGMEKGLFVISACAMPEIAQFDALVLTLKRIAYNLNMNYLGQILRPESHSLTYIKEYGYKISGVLDNIEKAGAEFAKNFSVSPETMNTIQSPITKDAEDFIKVNNSKWHRALNR